MVGSKTGCSPTLHAWVVLRGSPADLRGKEQRSMSFMSLMSRATGFDPGTFAGLIRSQLDQDAGQTVTSV